jgi:hypothetical protein
MTAEEEAQVQAIWQQVFDGLLELQNVTSGDGSDSDPVWLISSARKLAMVAMGDVPDSYLDLVTKAIERYKAAKAVV